MRQVKFADLESLVGEIDAGDDGTLARHRLCKNPASAPDIHDRLAGERSAGIDPFQAQRIDFMQGAEFRMRIPPAVSKVAEFLQFCRVGVHMWSINGYDDGSARMDCSTGASIVFCMHGPE